MIDKNEFKSDIIKILTNDLFDTLLFYDSYWGIGSEEQTEEYIKGLAEKIMSKL